jgi:hypothetical protein
MWLLSGKKRLQADRDQTTVLLTRAGDLADKMSADAQLLIDLVAEVRETEGVTREQHAR